MIADEGPMLEMSAIHQNLLGEKHIIPTFVDQNPFTTYLPMQKKPSSFQNYYSSTYCKNISQYWIKYNLTVDLIQENNKFW